MWSWQLATDNLEISSELINDTLPCLCLFIRSKLEMAKCIYFRQNELWYFIFEFCLLFHLPPGFDNTFATTTDGRGSPIPRIGSPDLAERPFSPDRSGSPSKVDQTVMEIDPETIRIALRDFAQRLKGIEKERVRNSMNYPFWPSYVINVMFGSYEKYFTTWKAHK